MPSVVSTIVPGDSCKQVKQAQPLDRISGAISPVGPWQRDGWWTETGIREAGGRHCSAHWGSCHCLCWCLVAAGGEGKEGRSSTPAPCPGGELGEGSSLAFSLTPSHSGQRSAGAVNPPTRLGGAKGGWGKKGKPDERARKRAGRQAGRLHSLLPPLPGLLPSTLALAHPQATGG